MLPDPCMCRSRIYYRGQVCCISINVGGYLSSLVPRRGHVRFESDAVSTSQVYREGRRDRPAPRPHQAAVSGERVRMFHRLRQLRPRLEYTTARQKLWELNVEHTGHPLQSAITPSSRLFHTHTRRVMPAPKVISSEELSNSDAKFVTPLHVLSVEVLIVCNTGGSL